LTHRVGSWISHGTPSQQELPPQCQALSWWPELWLLWLKRWSRYASEYGNPALIFLIYEGPLPPWRSKEKMLKVRT
jgi:hypothetical protein